MSGRRQRTLAALANALGHCVAADSAPALGPRQPNREHRLRIRKIARILDRLARAPATSRWQRRAERVHFEITKILRDDVPESSGGSLWAAV